MRLTTKEISFLAKDFNEKTLIGIFSNINDTPTGQEQKSLEEKDLYKEGVLTDEAERILSIAARPSKSARLMVQDSNIFVEKYTYRVNDKIVLAENAGGDLEFSIVNDLEKTITEVSEFSGLSSLKSSDIKVLVNSEELLVLLAIIDIYRNNALLSYAGQNISKESVSFKQIVNQLNNPSPNSLVRMIRNNYNYSIPAIENIKNILDMLIQKNCVSFDSAYILTPEYAVFAKSFLIPETIVTIETINQNNKDELIVSGGLFVCAGVRDILFFVFGTDDIELASVSARQMLKTIENFLKCPDIG